MLKRIIRPSELLVKFILALHLTLSKPQQGHVIRTADAIVVCEERKTLSALYRQWVEAPDVSAVADCFRVSPWTADDLRQPLAAFVIRDLLERAEAAGIEPVIFVIIDDSTTRKDKDTSHLEAVDWVFDHAAAGKGQTRYCKGAVHVTCKVQIGPWSYTFTWRLYLRACAGARRRCGDLTVGSPKRSACASRASTPWPGRCWRNSDRTSRKATKSMSCSTVGMRRAS